MLEEMAAFFEARLEEYDSHMLRDIADAAVFYAFTAQCLPEMPCAKVLDLGCGTGLELQWYFDRNATAQITGVDLSAEMLKKLREKFPGKDLNLICGSYFSVPLGENAYDAAVSVESLHHFTQVEKIGLYKKLFAALKQDGVFVLTDYFSLSEEEERMHRDAYLRLKKEIKADDSLFYHYDTPLTVAHETEDLLQAGFRSVEIAGQWGATHTVLARK